LDLGSRRMMKKRRRLRRWWVWWWWGRRRGVAPFLVLVAKVGVKFEGWKPNPQLHLSIFYLAIHVVV
jgi:hypothetical protein